MPTVPRIIQAEISLDELKDELKAFAKQVQAEARSRLSLSKFDGSEGETLVEGEFVVPTIAVMQQNQTIQPDTFILVVEEFPTIGVFLGAFHTRDGKVQTSTFAARQFVAKHDP